jgi:hypothetical protein
VGGFIVDIYSISYFILSLSLYLFFKFSHLSLSLDGTFMDNVWSGSDNQIKRREEIEICIALIFVY